MVKPVTRLSIPMLILRLNFITKLIFIHLISIPGKIHNATSHIVENYPYMFLHITLVTSLLIHCADLTPKFSKSNYIYPYNKWYKSYVCSNSIVKNVVKML